MSKIIHFDPSDFVSILKLMDEFDSINELMPGTNENGEDVWISALSDNVTVKTFQKNGWVRINIYWRDGTCEEIFDGRWDRE